ncbi:MAG: hypothetical protein KF800_06030 [Lysobacter sp.]|nr:hypothetical protein [Lysobacter sp.]
MNNDTAIAKRSRFAPRRLLKFAAVGAVSLVMLYVVADWAWTMSGSNEWKLKIDENGTKVYTLKAPGDPSIKVRGVTRSNEFTLSTHIAPFFDENIQKNCGEWVEGCFEYRILKRWEKDSPYNVTMWSVAMPPFQSRQILLQGNLWQDPVTKVLTLENIAVPNKLPVEDCCVRLDHVHNVFKYTPIGDGNIEVELIYDMDMGGLFPRHLLSLAAPSVVHKMLSEDTPKLLRRPEYLNAKLDFIDEGLKNAPGAAPTPAADADSAPATAAASEASAPSVQATAAAAG